MDADTSNAAVGSVGVDVAVLEEEESMVEDAVDFLKVATEEADEQSELQKDEESRERTYEAHKSPDEVSSDEMDFDGDIGELEEDTYEPHKSGDEAEVVEIEDSDSHNSDGNEEKSESELRWKKKIPLGDDIFVLEHTPPTGNAKFTPCVVGGKLQASIPVDTVLDPMTDAPNSAVRLPKGIASVKKGMVVCFHPRQFHKVEEANYRSLLDKNSVDFKKIQRSLEGGWNQSFLGTFCPAFDDKGKYLVNRWNEIKFVAPDGMHRCAAQVEKWKQNPDAPSEQLACYGLWEPELNYNVLAQRKIMWSLGTHKNETQGVIFQDTLGIVLASLQKNRKLLEEERQRKNDPKKISDEEVCKMVGRKYPTHAFMFKLLNKFPPKAIDIIIRDCAEKGSNSRLTKRAIFESINKSTKAKVYGLSTEKKIKLVEYLRESSPSVKGEKTIQSFYDVFFTILSAQAVCQPILRRAGTAEQRKRFSDVMKKTLALVGVRQPGGVKPELLPSFTKEQFQNYILRGNADDHGEAAKTVEKEEEKEAENSQEDGETGEEDPTQTYYKMENCHFEKTTTADNSVDLVITDIPYNIYPDKEYDRFSDEDIASLASMLKKKMKANSAGFIFASSQQLPILQQALTGEGFQVVKNYFHFCYENSKPTQRQVQFWEGSVDTGLAFYCGRLTALTNVNARLRLTFKNFSIEKRATSTELCRENPSSKPIRGSEQKPLYLMEKLFREENSQENSRFTVWDPFCGTGTTGVACAKFGLKFIGTDKDRDVYNIAFRRVDEFYNKADRALVDIGETPGEEDEEFPRSRHRHQSSSSSSSSTSTSSTSTPTSTKKTSVWKKPGENEFQRFVRVQKEQNIRKRKRQEKEN